MQAMSLPIVLKKRKRGFVVFLNAAKFLKFIVLIKAVTLQPLPFHI